MSIPNLQKFFKRMEKRLIENPRVAVKPLVARSTMLVRNTAVTSIQAGGSGETVQKYNPRRTHTQSAPNQPPASDTGFLVSNISTEVKSFKDGMVVGKIISAAPYSKHLEFGTTKMTERPFMLPALEKNKHKIKKLFKDARLTK
jgi:HK97 gp10 family phage protein